MTSWLFRDKLSWLNIVNGPICCGRKSDAFPFCITASFEYMASGVIHEEFYKQRIQKYFDGVPCEIFVNNFKHIYEYFEPEYKINKPVSAHMIATGTVLIGEANSELKELIKVANKFLLISPPLIVQKKRR